MIDRVSLSKLKDDALQVLRGNDMGKSTKPAPRLYPHQWNWDSAFIAIGLSHLDEERAQQEILSLLQGQWKNGMIPHIIFDPRYADYHPNPAFWNSSTSLEAPKTVQTSGITQPPLLASAAYEVFNNSTNKKKATIFLRTIYTSLKNYLSFFYDYRDTAHEGLAYIIHPWESGLDNSPRWDEALDNVETKWTPKYKRVDNKLVSSEQRPSDKEYDRYSYLVELFRNSGYDSNRIRNKCPFIVQPILFNCLLYKSCQSLIEIGIILSEDTTEIEKWALKTKNGICSKLWDEGSKIFCDFDMRTNRRITKNTIASYIPLYAGIPSQSIADILVAILMSSAEYWPENGYPLCSVSMREPEFNPIRYWRGPVWINTNWLIIKGLRNYGYHREAARLTEKTIELVAKSGHYEYFNPFTGQGYGSGDFSWSASLMIDLIETYGGCK